MEATIPIIAETSQALGLPLAVTLSLIIIAAVIIMVVVLREHRSRIDNIKEAVAAMKSDTEKEISGIKEEMAKQAAVHNAELSALYKLINGVAVDVSFIKGRISKDEKK